MYTLRDCTSYSSNANFQKLPLHYRTVHYRTEAVLDGVQFWKIIVVYINWIIETIHGVKMASCGEDMFNSHEVAG